MPNLSGVTYNGGKFMNQSIFLASFLSGGQAAIAWYVSYMIGERVLPTAWKGNAGQAILYGFFIFLLTFFMGGKSSSNGMLTI